MTRLQSPTVIGLAIVAFATSISFAQAKTRCTIIADASDGRIISQTGTCDQQITPASTFKIALSLMGYDSGYLTSEHSPVLPFHQGYADWMASWKSDTDPTSWISNSVVWYSQLLTVSLGEDRFRAYVKQFNYGNADVSGNPGRHDGLTEAWLGSSLKISPIEQIRFLEDLVNRRLFVSARAYTMTANITKLGDQPAGWEIHGKTGTGFPLKKDGSADEEHAYGWFVAYSGAWCSGFPAHRERGFQRDVNTIPS